MRCAEKPQRRGAQQPDSKTPKLEDPGPDSLEQFQLALPTLPSSRAMKCAELPEQEGCRLGVPAGRLPAPEALYLCLQTALQASNGTCHPGGLGHQKEFMTPPSSAREGEGSLWLSCSALLLCWVFRGKANEGLESSQKNNGQFSY